MGEAGRARMLSRFTLGTTAAGLASLYRRQRQAARGAWRPHVSAGRLLLAILLHVPILGRAMVFDLYLRTVLPHWLGTARGRAAWLVWKLWTTLRPGRARREREVRR